MSPYVFLSIRIIELQSRIDWLSKYRKPYVTSEMEIEIETLEVQVRTLTNLRSGIHTMSTQEREFLYLYEQSVIAGHFK